MRIIRLAIIGAAVAAGIGYIIRKNEEGESVLDEISEHLPDFLDQAKNLGTKALKNFIADIKL